MVTKKLLVNEFCDKPVITCITKQPVVDNIYMYVLGHFDSIGKHLKLNAV